VAAFVSRSGLLAGDRPELVFWKNALRPAGNEQSGWLNHLEFRALSKASGAAGGNLVPSYFDSITSLRRAGA
jgi:hypothetical protein